MRYRRARVAGATYFFTVVTRNRSPVLTSPSVLPLLGAAFRAVRERAPFTTDAIVVLPDHLHCIWTLPADDTDFSGRWRRVKRFVTTRAGIGSIWQPRFWEHLIRGDDDYRQHVDYIHYNPVKHGLVNAPREWQHTSFHRHAAAGRYAMDWGAGVAPQIPGSVGRE
jgi:putative transposase